MSTEHLIETLRARAKFHSGLDWKLFRESADALEGGGGSITPEQIMHYFQENEIKLLPWQCKKLINGISNSENT